MTPGSVFFDEDFHFHDGETGEKLFVVLGSNESITIVAKTTSRQHGRGLTFGCQPTDRFHNFYLPPGCCYLRTNTWVCLNEFYELNAVQILQKRFQGVVKPVCTIEDAITRQMQDCALQSLDITSLQEIAIQACLLPTP